MFKELFLKYVSFDTMSDSASTTSPSTSTQLILADELISDLKSIGVNEIHKSDTGLVYAKVPGNTKNGSIIGFLAHMDTSPDASGKNVKPRIISNYDWKDITLDNGLVMDTKTYTSLKRHVGSDLIVTDGNTLLGADNKAGIAIIMSFVNELIKNQIAHNDIYICFTPDEEIGRGTENFEKEFFPVEFCYTVDGGASELLCYENFNAANAVVTINGISEHPGSAKGKMVNASTVAMEFHQNMNKYQTAENTEDREGFNHLLSISGVCASANLVYIIRNHDLDTYNKQIEDFKNIQNFLNKKYNYQVVDLEITESYKNMYEVVKDFPRVIDLATDAITNIIGKCVPEAIRGGTDGARLTFMGLPCPNLGTGGYNFHGVREYLSIQEALKMIEVLHEINKLNIK